MTCLPVPLQVSYRHCPWRPGDFGESSISAKLWAFSLGQKFAEDWAMCAHSCLWRSERRHWIIQKWSYSWLHRSYVSFTVRLHIPWSMVNILSGTSLEKTIFLCKSVSVAESFLVRSRRPCPIPLSVLEPHLAWTCTGLVQAATVSKSSCGHQSHCVALE